MAYRPDDLYNTGINTIGTDLGLGNIQGQNIQVADASIEALLNKERERIGLGPTKVKETFPRFLADEYGTYKSYMGGPGATQLIVDEYQGTFPSLLNVPIKDLQERFDIGLENPDLMQVKKDDDEKPYDFSGIRGHIAFNPFNPFLGVNELFGLLTKGGISKKAVQDTVIKNLALNQIGKKTGPFIAKKIREARGEKFGGTGKFKNIATGTKDYGPHKKSTPTPTPRHAPHPHRGGGGGGNNAGGAKLRSGMTTGQHRAFRMADGGLINFYRYGGFI